MPSLDAEKTWFCVTARQHTASPWPVSVSMQSQGGGDCAGHTLIICASRAEAHARRAGGAGTERSRARADDALSAQRDGHVGGAPMAACALAWLVRRQRPSARSPCPLTRRRSGRRWSRAPTRRPCAQRRLRTRPCAAQGRDGDGRRHASSAKPRARRGAPRTQPASLWRSARVSGSQREARASEPRTHQPASCWYSYE
jgi:hypothetical protein